MQQFMGDISTDQGETNQILLVNIDTRVDKMNNDVFSEGNLAL